MNKPNLHMNICITYIPKTIINYTTWHALVSLVIFHNKFLDIQCEINMYVI